MSGDVVVALNVDILIDHAAGGEESARIKRPGLIESVAGEVGERIVLVLTHLIPCRSDAGDLAMSAKSQKKSIEKRLGYIPYRSNARLGRCR